MMPHTAEVPKCMFQLTPGMRVLDWILAALSEAGVRDITFIGGYRMDAVSSVYPQLKFIDNTDWPQNNILASLICASSELNEPVVVTYSDIVYQTDIVKSLLVSDAQIALAFDPEWRVGYRGRTMHPEAQAEKVILNDGFVGEIGKHLDSAGADGEFIGLAYFSVEGAILAQTRFGELVADGWEKPFQRSATLRQAYLTDMLQELIDRGVSIKAHPVMGFWRELDTPEDVLHVQEAWCKFQRHSV